MKKLVQILFYASCLSTIPVGALQGGRSVVPAAENEFPFVVSLARAPATDPRHHFCGGTLISKRNILTAAHCLVNATNNRLHIDITDIRVTIGSNDMTQGKKYAFDHWITIERWAEHYGFALPYEMFHDLSIIQLSEDVVDVAPARISLCKHRQLRGLDAVTMGWGLMDDGSQPKLLQKAKLRVISRKRCRNNFVRTDGPAFQIVNHLCTTQNPPVIFGCGDSGGPLLINGNELIGVNESVCANNITHPNEQNSHLSVEYYRRFIEEFAEAKAPCSMNH